MSRYYGVIGNRDHIKIKGEKIPFWAFLDRQPDGYLTSLVYMRKDLPDMPMIFDCGAWSYRLENVPKITPQLALDGYLQLAKPGNILIAPDHMLIPGVDLGARKKFNTESAKEFIKICPVEYLPMATLHGMNLEDRIANGKVLVDIGYKYIAVGGVAARASQKSLVLSMVRELRKELPGVWLHILGLSSPDYAAAWNKYGVESFDGSSHFKQAFTAGAFFTVDGGKLKKWQAARPGEDVSAPECFCKACTALKGESVDTRTYGSNEHNMGRAAHNMNMLMKAQSCAIDGTTVLVSCVGKKKSTAVTAKDLYQSEWFKKAKAYAETVGDRWFILSAKHGLLSPERIVGPYECTLNEMPIAERREWGERTTGEIEKEISGGRIVILAGEKYAEFLDLSKYYTERPMKGFGIGKQLAWLKKQTEGQLKLWQ
jgi:hypothetical protein